MDYFYKYNTFRIHYFNDLIFLLVCSKKKSIKQRWNINKYDNSLRDFVQGISFKTENNL